MSFVVRKTKHRAWPVTVKQPMCDEAGVVTETEATFVAHFAPFTEAEIEAAIETAAKDHPVPGELIAGEQVSEDGSTKPLPEVKNIPMSVSLIRNAAVFRRVVVGWGPEVKDETGVSLPFSADALTALVTGPDGIAVSGAFNRALFELRYGVARQKNLSASPAPGGNSVPAEAATSLPATSPSSE